MHTIVPVGCYIISDGPERHMVALVKNGYCIVCRVPYEYVLPGRLVHSFCGSQEPFPPMLAFLIAGRRFSPPDCITP